MFIHYMLIVSLISAITWNWTSDMRLHLVAEMRMLTDSWKSCFFFNKFGATRNVIRRSLRILYWLKLKTRWHCNWTASRLSQRHQVLCQVLVISYSEFLDHFQFQLAFSTIRMFILEISPFVLKYFENFQIFSEKLQVWTSEHSKIWSFCCQISIDRDLNWM